MLAKEVMIVTGVDHIGMMIVRRTGHGKRIVIGSEKLDCAQEAAESIREEGFDAIGMEVDVFSRESILEFIAGAQKQGEISMFVNTAGLFFGQDSVKSNLKKHRYGMTVLLEETGKVIMEGGSGVIISARSDGWLPVFRIEAFRWAEKHIRLNLISPKIPAVLPKGKEFPEVTDEIVNLAEFLLCNKSAFITGADFLLFD